MIASARVDHRAVVAISDSLVQPRSPRDRTSYRLSLLKTWSGVNAGLKLHQLAGVKVHQ
jgi:hypothetical protein